MSTELNPRFAGVARLYGVDALQRLRRAHVCVVGLGGVGSWSVEALARTGVGSLTLVDLDEVCLSNTNRQLHALTNTVGRTKVSVLVERVRAIAPGSEVHGVEDFVVEANASTLIRSDFDVVIDAIDSLSSKCALLLACRARGVAAIVVGGCGGRVDPTRVKIDDVSATHHDRLLRLMRKRLRQDHDFPRQGRWGVTAVFSDEPRRFALTEPQRRDQSSLDCSGGLGAVAHLTATFGLFAAHAAIDHIVALGRRR